MNDNTNFFFAIAMSILILMGFHYFYEAPKQKALQAKAQATQILNEASPAKEETVAPRARADVLKDSPRVRFQNDKIHGSLNLQGSRFDDLTLIKYREAIDPQSPEIILLSPVGSEAPALPYYAEFGWLAADQSLQLPNSQSLWRSNKTNAEIGETVTLNWTNTNGLTFEREITLDKNYVFTITEKVTNASNAAISLFPYALISRHGTPKTSGFAILHEGPIGVLDGQLREHNYSKLKDEGLASLQSTGGWLGMTDVYWLVSLIAPPEEKLTARFLHSVVNQKDRYQVDMQANALDLPQGGSITHTFHLFAGAKEVSALDAYTKDLHAPMFDKAIDFGWFYVFAKPFFYTIEFFYGLLGNYGLAIIAFTILLRLLFYPMQESMYVNMARMKDVQPEMARIKERHGNDPARMNEEMQKLYKKEKLNPLAGCLPIFVQIPIFFALYKVLLVSIEMRHAPFYGWVHDLSAPDPSNLFELFGLVAWGAPDWMHLGVWPILMGITMFVQQKLSPPPPDKTTAQIFLMLPLVFTFLLASMAAGLVIYWTFSNLLAIAQQVLIKHRTKDKVKT